MAEATQMMGLYQTQKPTGLLYEGKVKFMQNCDKCGVLCLPYPIPWTGICSWCFYGICQRKLSLRIQRAGERGRQ